MLWGYRSSKEIKNLRLTKNIKKRHIGYAQLFLGKVLKELSKF